ncbi:hypothetical protein [Tatumella ptyseos]|nr:hypothetical protein [Tatumella ptyseos]WKX27331.1 hypothetical protein QJR74_04090 [Tatumella ptyseos]
MLCRRKRARHALISGVTNTCGAQGCLLNDDFLAYTLLFAESLFTVV